MSRIGRKHVAIPAGVEVKLDGTLVTVKGPKGTLQQNIHPNMIVKVEGAEVIVERPDDAKENRSLHGLTRTLIANMVEGVTNGYAKTLEIVGVGHKAAVSNGALNLALGYSHLQRRKRHNLRVPQLQRYRCKRHRQTARWSDRGSDPRKETA